MSEAENARIAVIGAGAFGQRYVRALQALSGAEVAWVCDLDGGAARATAGLNRVPGHSTDAAEATGDPDVHALVVVTPEASHRELTIMAPEAGKHTIVEKPLATEEDSTAAWKAAASSSWTRRDGRSYTVSRAVHSVRCCALTSPASGGKLPMPAPPRTRPSHPCASRSGSWKTRNAGRARARTRTLRVDVAQTERVRDTRLVPLWPCLPAGVAGSAPAAKEGRRLEASATAWRGPLGDLGVSLLRHSRYPSCRCSNKDWDPLSE